MEQPASVCCSIPHGGCDSLSFWCFYIFQDCHIFYYFSLFFNDFQDLHIYLTFKVFPISLDIPCFQYLHISILFRISCLPWFSNFSVISEVFCNFEFSHISHIFHSLHTSMFPELFIIFTAIMPPLWKTQDFHTFLIFHIFIFSIIYLIYKSPGSFSESFILRVLPILWSFCSFSNF